MKSRLLVAAVGVPLLLVILLVCPAIVTALSLSFLCAVGAREMLKTTGILDHARMIGYSMLFAFLVPIWSYFGSPLLPFVIGTVIFALLLFTESLLAYPHVRFESVTGALFAGIVIPLCLSSILRCQTCKNRKYQDGSDENVSFKAAAHISPEDFSERKSWPRFCRRIRRLRELWEA